MRSGCERERPVYRDRIAGAGFIDGDFPWDSPPDPPSFPCAGLLIKAIKAFDSRINFHLSFPSRPFPPKLLESSRVPLAILNYITNTLIFIFINSSAKALPLNFAPRLRVFSLCREPEWLPSLFVRDAPHNSTRHNSPGAQLVCIATSHHSAACPACPELFGVPRRERPSRARDLITCRPEPRD